LSAMWNPIRPEAQHQPDSGTLSPSSATSSPSFEAPSRPQAAAPRASRPRSAKVCSSKARSTVPSPVYRRKVEGSVNLPGNRVTIGRNGQVRPTSMPAKSSFSARSAATSRQPIALIFVLRLVERRCGCGTHQHRDGAFFKAVSTSASRMPIWRQPCTAIVETSKTA